MRETCLHACRDRGHGPVRFSRTAIRSRGAPDRAAVAAADAIIARLVKSPSLLLDAGDDLDAWPAATGDGDAKSRVVAPALEAKARAVLDDRMVHLAIEFSVLLDPGDAISRADLAYLDAR